MNVLEELKKSLGAPMDGGALNALDVLKTVSTSTGLVAYDLQAPAKNLYPVLTPLRNIIPRTPGGVGTATNWKQITSITGSGYNAMGYVAEGQRTARMSYTAVDKAASYRTLGEEDQVTYEAISAGQTFEDVRATAAMRVLQKMMLKEENAILGGNGSVLLGTPTTPTLSASGSGATLPTLTYSVIVVALTYEGYLGSSLSGGVPTSQVITGADAQTYTLSGGSSQKSAAATQAITLGQTLFCSTPAITGACGYAWYTGAAGAEKLEAITTINSAKFTAPLLGTGQAATAITADNSRNATLGFDGLLIQPAVSGSLALNTKLATGTAGTGTPLTASGRGSIVEIDTMLQSMWDNYKISPTAIWCNSQELKNITAKVLSNTAGPLLQYFKAAEGADEYRLAAGGRIDFYFNPFAIQGGQKIPISVHPTLPPGTILLYCGNLPEQYQNNNVPNTFEVKVRRDYYQIDWPLRTRAQEFGVYAEEVLAVYATFGIGILSNVADG